MWISNTARALAILALPILSLSCRAQPRGPVQQESSVYQRMALDAERIEADAKPLIEKLVAEANAEGASRKGQVWVNEGQYDRMVVFVPAEDGGSSNGRIRDMEIERTGDREVPAGAVMSKWTDRFALAQEYSYEYSFLEFKDGFSSLIPLRLEVLAILDFKEHQRRTIAGVPKPLPKIPDRFAVWQKPFLLTARGGPRTKSDIDPFRRPSCPGVLAHEANRSPLVGEALKALELAPLKTHSSRATATLRYDFDKGAWTMKSLAFDSHRGAPEPPPGKSFSPKDRGLGYPEPGDVLPQNWFQPKGK